MAKPGALTVPMTNGVTDEEVTVRQTHVIVTSGRRVQCRSTRQLWACSLRSLNLSSDGPTLSNDWTELQPSSKRALSRTLRR
jgi:hypothetical protein